MFFSRLLYEVESWHEAEQEESTLWKQHQVTCFTLYPVFALVSINITLSSLALCSPSSVVICLKREMQIGEKVTKALDLGDKSPSLWLPHFLSVM